MYVCAGKMNFFTRENVQACLDPLISFYGFQRGVITVMIGDDNKIVTMLSVFGSDDCRILMTVRTAGVNMQITAIGKPLT